MLDRFRLAYRLELSEGRVRVAIGRAPPSFVAAVADVARLHRIRAGRIDCVGEGKRARLRFSHGFPERGRQAIRNVWTPPSAPGPGGGRRAQG